MNIQNYTERPCQIKTNKGNVLAIKQVLCMDEAIEMAIVQNEIRNFALYFFDITKGFENIL